MARAVWNGVVLAESDDVIVVDGYTYFPEATLKREHFRESTHESVCPWKGTASYWDVVVGGEVNKGAAWMYRDPKPEAKHVGGRVGFWRVSIES
jgi:uncharacterized protein (DUF427 family)